MRLPVAVSIAVCTLVAAPTALAAPSDRTFPVNGDYKGRTSQKLLTTFKIANRHVDSFETSFQRFCSGGTTDFVHVSATTLAGQSGSALKPGRNGTWKLKMAIPVGSGVTANVQATLRNGWLKGTAAFSDVAGLPEGPSAGAAPTQAPAPGATCSTQQNVTSNKITFKTHWG